MCSLHVKYPLFLSDFNETWVFWQFFEMLVSNFMKICPVGAEFNADERTDMAKLIVAFRNFYERA
jgi:hypothetical protein